MDHDQEITVTEIIGNWIQPEYMNTRVLMIRRVSIDQASVRDTDMVGWISGLFHNSKNTLWYIIFNFGVSFLCSEFNGRVILTTMHHLQECLWMWSEGNLFLALVKRVP